MDYGKEEWIKVYTRDTASWRCTSLAARGLALELSRNMGRFSDEISLGARGLRAVAGLVNAPWEEVEPLLTELLRDARLEYYPDRQVLRDPEHLVRQEAVTSDAQRKRDSRARGRMQVTRGHDESRDAGHVSPQVTLGHDQKEEREERWPPYGGRCLSISIIRRKPCEASLMVTGGVAPRSGTGSSSGTARAGWG